MCIYIYIYVYAYSRMSNVYTHSLPSAPPSSSQPGIFHSATPKCVLFYSLCEFVPVRPSFLPSFRHFVLAGRGLWTPCISLILFL